METGWRLAEAYMKGLSGSCERLYCSHLTRRTYHAAKVAKAFPAAPYRFEDFQLALLRYELRHNGRFLKLE